MQLTYLADFYAQMRMLRETRYSVVSSLRANETIEDQYISHLKRIENQLYAIPKAGNYYKLKTYDDDHVFLELDYELGEIKKDSIYLEQGQQALENYFSTIHTDFKKQITRGLDFLKNRKFDHFVTDRDGTIANYCGRYQSSIQGIYNAMYLSDFAKKIPGKRIILSAAPLYHIGLLAISVQPKTEYVFAGSKGCEFVDISGDKFYYPIDEKQQEKLNQLNQAIEKILQKKEFSTFRYIGSGLQYKFGQTTLAHQDKNLSISLKRSLELKKRIQQLLKELDPDAHFFKMLDTGKDLEITLTHKKEGREQVEDFDKGHGLNFLIEKLKMEVYANKILICGDTASDLPMLQAAKDLQADVTCIFVTTDAELQTEVRKICPDALMVTSPDILVSILKHFATLNTFE